MTKTHQTTRLSPGSHHDPEAGMCVMELASMLAGERFSDHPRCASPIIGAFLRTYNDLLPDERRQDLYVYASRVVGTRASVGVERWRAQECMRWAHATVASRPGGWWRRRWLHAELARTSGDCEWASVAARVAGAYLRRDGGVTHAAALALVDSLIESGDAEAGDARSSDPEQNAALTLAGR
jgi:hypothetical protein